MRPRRPPKRKAKPAAGTTAEIIVWTGVLTGSATQQIARISDYAHNHAVVPVDMADVERIDFVCAGALLNAISRIEAQRKSVQIVGASPIIRALLAHRHLAAPFHQEAAVVRGVRRGTSAPFHLPIRWNPTTALPSFPSAATAWSRSAATVR